MGKGIGNRRYESCWAYRSTFEKALIISSLLPFLIIVVLITFLLFQLSFHRFPNSCTNPVCQLEATQLAQRLDPSTDPCQNFYQFSCGNLWKNTNESSDPFSAIIQESKHQILQVYNEPIKTTDHKIVKAAKLLYKSCLNTTKIKQSGLTYISETLQWLGGWPVVDGVKWNETNFEWIRTTQILREMGMFYSSFIDVSVIPNTIADSKFSLKVALPRPDDVQIRDAGDFMEMAETLGADKNKTLEEYEEIYKFSMDLRREIFLRYNDESPEKYTLAEFQSKYEFINWKEFINSILGPTVQIRETDLILFDSPDGFNHWVNFLTKTPKRIQANYMIWKALERLLPYIPGKELYEDRKEFCIQQVREGFSPSPLDITYVQKYLPDTKIALANDLVNNMKLEVLQVLDRCDWLDESEKRKVEKRLKNMKQIIGAPVKYLSQTIFYEMDVDMEEFNESEENFISNLLKTNRNYQSRVYQQIYNGEMVKWSLQTGSLIGDYYWEDNIISIPATVLQGAIFNEARPKYVNYGSIGMLLSHHFFRILIGERARIFDTETNPENLVYQKLEEKLSRCLDAQLNNTYLVDIILQQSLGFEISYNAYKKSVHSKEDLGFSGYTANQLYWLSAAAYFCQPHPNISNIVTNNNSDIFSRLFLSSIASNKNFGEDFHCSLETNMHPRENCTIFL